MKRALHWLAALVIGALPLATMADDQGDVFSKGNLAWDDLLTDNAAGAVTAAGFLDLSGDTVKPVENVRDLVVSLKGLDANGDKATFGLSITPARTRLMRPQLSRYADSYAYRFLSATTLSYAQGGAEVEGRSYDRRAIAIDSGFFLDDDDDPVIALLRMDERGECGLFDRSPPGVPGFVDGAAPGGPRPPPGAGPPPGMRPGPPPGAPHRPGPGRATNGATVPAATPGAAVPARADDAEAERQRARSAECRERVTQGLRWNRSYVSASLATGWVKPVDGGSQHRLGNTLALGLVYGFDHLSLLRERAMLTLSWRRTTGEPVLSTLDAAAVQTRDSSLLVARLAGGSSTIRALLEVSNASSGNGTTSSQRAFTRALGLDVRVQEGLWVGLRFGRQRKIDGTGTEIGSLLSLSYSPTALLKR